LRAHPTYYWKYLRQRLYLLAQIVLWCGVVAHPAIVDAAETPAIEPQALKIGQITAIVNNANPQQIGVSGEIDKLKHSPIEIDRWLLPFDATLKLLGIQQKQLINGELELTAAYLQVRLDPRQLRSHPQLGRAIAIGELRKLPGVKIEFDEAEVDLKFSYALPKNPPKPVAIPPKVSLDGLTAIDPPTASLSALQERINLSGSATDRVNTQGEFKAVGTVYGSSWYLRVDQPKLANLLTWGLSDAVVINQNPSADWIAGSQAPFWRRQGNPIGSYWGFTTIQRQNFTPTNSLSGGDIVPNERLQSSQLGRTVVGQAQPGTVVRLVRGFGTVVVAQVLVDSSGVFRFENVPVSNEGGFGNNYRLFLYPSGQLSADPQIRDVNFTTVPGQLPAGAGAIIGSVGANYNRIPNEFVGKLDGLQGGVAYRRGISESLTVGGGVIADPLALRGSSEIFWQPTGVPLKASVSAVTGDRWDMVSNVNYQPTPKFNANFNSDKFSSRADLNWQVAPQFTAVSNYDSLSGVAVGGNYNFSLAPKSFSTLQGTLDSNSFVRWSASHQQNEWQLRLQGNEISFNSEISYRLPAPIGISQNLVANYQSTRSIAQTEATTLSQLSWRYQSSSLQSELGYGWSGFGRGANASIGMTVSPGLQLLGRYQGISAFTNQQSFSLEVQSTLDFQGGVRVANTRVEDLRTSGGISLQPFFDRNGNGKLDSGEESYWHPELITLDKKALDPSQTTKLTDRVEVRAAPGSYRLDLHTSRLPERWRSSVDSLRVNVALGSYTNIPIPLRPIYTVKGIVADAGGKPLPNTEVTAIHLADAKISRSTKTKADGSYQFEDLAIGAYQISVSGRSQPAVIAIVSNSPVIQQLNLIRLDNDNFSSKSRSRSVSFRESIVGDSQAVFMHLVCGL
jgi:Carboxypeptidase regulatory-like domain